MGIRRFLIGLISLCMIGCAPKQIENGEIESEKQLVLINSYETYGSGWIMTDSVFLYKEVKNDTLIFIYENDFSFSMFANNDSSVLVGDIKCSLVKNKTFIINDRKFIVSKYYYDKENVEDEEFSFYINSDYGFLLSEGRGRPSHRYSTYFIAHDNISNILIDAIIGDFDFRQSYIISPPPPPPPLVERQL